MCTYSIVIEDNLAAKAEELLNGQPLQAWIEQQLETLVSKPDVATAYESSKRLARLQFGSLRSCHGILPGYRQEALAVDLDETLSHAYYSDEVIQFGRYALRHLS